MSQNWSADGWVAAVHRGGACLTEVRVSELCSHQQASKSIISKRIQHFWQDTVEDTMPANNDTFCGYVKHFHLFQTRQGMWKLWSNLIPQNCCFQHNDQLTRGWISYGLTGAYTHTLLSRYGVISLIHYTSGCPETQSSMCTEKELSAATHSNASTFKAESNIQKGLRTFDDAWQFFSSIHASCVWGCRLDGERECVCLWERDGAGLRAGEEWLCETATDRQMGVGGGGRGWGCKGPRLLKSRDADG